MEHRLTAAMAALTFLGGIALLMWADARPFPDQYRASSQVAGVGLVFIAPVLGMLAWVGFRFVEPEPLTWVRRALMTAVAFAGIVILGNIPLA